MKILEKPRPLPKGFEKEEAWAFQHWGELVKKYPDQWIAYWKGKVLAHGKDLSQVLEKSHQQVNLEDIPHLFIEKGIHIY